MTALAWHPERTILVCGWENGELLVWNGLEGKEFVNIGGPHKTPITLVEFSEKGGRLVTCDTVGSFFKINNSIYCVHYFAMPFSIRLAL